MPQERICLILASSSPRRLQLLKQIGIEPELILPADIDETPHRNELPRPYAKRMAFEKARRIELDVPRKPEVQHVFKEQNCKFLILAADTVVSVGRRILPKTETEQEALECLELLSGRQHRVMTAVSATLCDQNGNVSGTSDRLSESRVRFKRLSNDEIKSYIESQEWKGKAGGYGIQGQAERYIQSISGSYSGIVGLPLYEAAQIIKGKAPALLPEYQTKAPKS